MTYSAFVDPSGGVSDSMTLAIAHLGRNAVCVLDAVLEVRPPFDPEQRWRNAPPCCAVTAWRKIVGDKYAGEWPLARFAEHGIEFEQSARPKSDLYHDLLPLLNARRIELARPAAPVGPTLRPRAAHRAQRQGLRSTMPRAATTTSPMRSPACWSASTSIAGSR